MKYYLNINGSEFGNVSQLEITSTYRRENIQMNLAGDSLIDRIGEAKVKLNVKLNFLTADQMVLLRAAKIAFFVPVIFDRGTARVEKNMHILDFTEPSPIYVNGKLSDGVYYGTVKITMEEM